MKQVLSYIFHRAGRTVIAARSMALMGPDADTATAAVADTQDVMPA